MPTDAAIQSVRLEKRTYASPLFASSASFAVNLLYGVV